MASRTVLVARTTRYLQRVSAPRAEMLLIMLLTAGTGLLTSFGLLQLGLEAMPIRYPLAVLVAYGAFLCYLWCWLDLRQRRLARSKTRPSHRTTDAGDSWEDVDFEDTDYSDDASRERRAVDFDLIDGGDLAGTPWRYGGSGASGRGGFSGRGGRFSGGGASGSFGEKKSFLGLGSLKGDGDSDNSGAGGLGPLLLLLLVLALLAFLTSYVIYIAPGLLAEVFVDGVLATGLYQHLKRQERRHWLATAFRRTWWYFLSVALLLSLASLGMLAYSPGATSIGEVDFGPIIDDLLSLVGSLLESSGE